MRRESVVAMLLVPLSLGVFARGAAAGGGDELVVWVQGLGAGMRAALRSFEQETGNKLVVSIYGSGMDPQKLMCGIAGGSPPDVIYQDRFAVGGWAARDAFMGGERSTKRLVELMRNILAEPGSLRVDYVEIVDPDSLEPLAAARPGALVAGAVYVGRARLIDNIVLDDDSLNRAEENRTDAP